MKKEPYQSMATRKNHRSELTVSAQSHVRANLMRSATQIAHQVEHYLEHGTIKVGKGDNEKVIPMTNERLSAYRLVLDRTIPTLSSTEITHKSALSNMDSTQLVQRLAEMAKKNPKLKERLLEALGERLIEAEVVKESPPHQQADKEPESQPSKPLSDNTSIMKSRSNDSTPSAKPPPSLGSKGSLHVGHK